MGRFFQTFFTAIGILVVGGCMLTCAGMMTVVNKDQVAFSNKPGVLFLELDGVIEDGEKFLNKLRRYRKDNHVRGVLIQINSPGGAVGPSQEIYAEIKRTREEFKKPVVVSGLGVMASGAYYAAVGADKIVVNAGTLVGSIGVIMQFANLEKLLEWAKISRYSIKTGQFKDTGAEYRPMTDAERSLLQSLVDDVLVQFKADIVAGRKIQASLVDENADGRIFTGAQAVKLGFADKVGTLDDAKKMVGEMAGLGPSPEIFKPRSWDRDELRTLIWQEEEESRFAGVLKRFDLGLKFDGQPLLIWPAAIGH